MNAGIHCLEKHMVRFFRNVRSTLSIISGDSAIEACDDRPEPRANPTGESGGRSPRGERSHSELACPRKTGAAAARACYPVMSHRLQRYRGCQGPCRATSRGRLPFLNLRSPVLHPASLEVPHPARDRSRPCEAATGPGVYFWPYVPHPASHVPHPPIPEGPVACQCSSPCEVTAGQGRHCSSPCEPDASALAKRPGIQPAWRAPRGRANRLGNISRAWLRSLRNVRQALPR